jgi:hypothetical protein
MLKASIGNGVNSCNNMTHPIEEFLNFLINSTFMFIIPV